MGTARDRALATAWRSAATLAGRTPPGLARPTLDGLADAVWWRRGAGVRQLEANLVRAAPHADIRSLSREAMRSYLRYWGELFTLPRWSPAEVLDRVLPHDDERLRDPLAAGRGVVGVLPHMGNWDLAGAWACLEGMPLTTVAERLRPDAVYDQFVAYRTRLGMEVLPLTGGPPTVPVLSERLRAGRFVCLLADRDLTRTGMVVSLLGEPARLPRGPALLALRTGAVLLPITTDYDGAGMHLRMHEPIELGSGSGAVAAATQQVADAFSAAIAEAPSDWHLLQRVFTADLEHQP
ncbi:MAG TPA: phosphatidylinositol mannoside acyltransferase [Nocardioidaceae bacterium]|nr:phosphatidylinositol mannoside acyltransferase [Nocardioidaceae bacterium]